VRKRKPGPLKLKDGVGHVFMIATLHKMSFAKGGNAVCVTSHPVAAFVLHADNRKKLSKWLKRVDQWAHKP